VPGATGAFTATCVFTGRHCGALVAFYEKVVETYPVVVGTPTTTAPTTAATSQTVSLPTLISGDMCLIAAGNNTPLTFTWPAGWTKFGEQTALAGALSLAYRICDGTEGASITVGLSASDTPAFIAHRITGAHQTTAPEVTVGASISTGAPNPPALTPSWAIEPTLWLAVTSNGGGLATVWPTNYTHHQTQVSAFGNGVLITCSRQAAIPGDDPSAFTCGGASNKCPATIAIRPAVTTAVPGNFPVIASTQSTTSTSGQTHVVNLPAGLAAGDICLGAVHLAAAVLTFTWPAGWIKIAEDTANPAGPCGTPRCGRRAARCRAVRAA